MSVNSNKKYKNSVFTTLFDEPEPLLELYNALSGSNLSPDTPIIINTLTDVLYMERINDVSFFIDDKVVVLLEHQSAINENMPLRFLMYIVQLYEKLFDNKAVYRKRLIEIPKPEFWVLYNGKEPYPEEQTLKLSDAFKDKSICEQHGTLELTVKVLNINKKINPDVLNRSQQLTGYVTFVAWVDENKEKGLDNAESIKEALHYCIDNQILIEFLQQHSVEVINMLMTEFNMDTAREVSRAEGKIEEKIEGKQEGKMEGKTEIAQNLLYEGMEIALVSKMTGLDVDTVKKLSECNINE